MNKEILDYKYKERTPTETVQIIKDFFEKKGFTLDLEHEGASEAGTYSCHIKLFFEGDFIMFSNGKGVTRDLALASGYAEMYERFCNGMKSFTQKNFYHKVKEVCEKTFGYKIHPQEKQLTYEQAVLEENNVNNYYSVASNYNEKIKERIVRTLTNDEFIGLPYKNVLTNDIKYIDPQLVLRFDNSTGMCAGNTYEEAFNEGFSEILERYCYIDLFGSEGLEKYHVVDLTKIENEILREKAENIKKAGYDFYLVDMSYEYGLPVIMGLLVNTRDHFCRLNFGSFPIFEVAAMRTITEAYQNVDSFKKYEDLIQVPAEKNFNLSTFLKENGTGLSAAAFAPAHFFTRIEQIDSYNKNFYMDVNSTPKEIYEYYMHFIAENDLNVWVIDNSLMKEVFSLHIYVDNLSYSYPMDYLVEYNDINYRYLFDQMEIMKKYEYMMYDISPNFQDIDHFDVEILLAKDIGTSLVTLLMYSQTIYPYFIDFDPFIRIVLDMDELNSGTIVRKYCWTFLFPYCKRYYTIRRYVDSNYSYEEMLPIMEKLGIKNFSKEEYEHAADLNYLLRKILIEPCWNYYHSDRYEKFCLALIEKI